MATWNSSYVPYEQQRHLHAAVAKNKLFLAGLGAGKTLTGLHEFVSACATNRECDGLIVAPTYPMLRDVIRPLWEDWIPRRLFAWKQGDQCIELWTGRRVFLRTGTHPDRMRGPNVGHAWFDEPAMVTSSRTWDMMAARVRDPRAVRPLILGTTTPRGYNWLIKTFARGGLGYHVTRARTRDNTYLPDDYEAGLRALYGEEFAAQELDARILDLQGLAWPLYGAVHMRLTLEQTLRIPMVGCFGGVDWGFTNPAALVIGCKDHDGRWYIVDLWYKRGHTRDKVAKAARELQDKWHVRRWYSDHDPEGVAQMRKVGCDVQLANKDVVAGVQHVRSLLPVRLDGQPRFNVLASLKAWHREQEGYQFPHNEDKLPSDKDEVPVGTNGDHAMDATRYLTYSHDLTWQDSTDYRSVESSRYEQSAWS